MVENMVICSECKELIVEHLYTVENYSTFKIKVRSDEFAGTSNFCMPRDTVVSIVESLSIMHNELKGSYEIKDCDSDAILIIDMDKLGHLSISGQIGGSHEEHYMKFKFSSDQTALAILKKILQSSIANNYIPLGER